MQLFNKLMSKIFGGAPSAATASTSTASAPASGGSQPAASGGNTGTATMPAAAASGGTTAAPAAVDVNAVLNEMASKNSEKLDWKKSIVDLMKLVGMDSSLSSRKELATELGYTGNKDDSAAMNIWLHKQVLRKLAENGGKVPQNLLD
jgi:dihydroorotase-like cyclic amidohydrolase